MKGHGKRYKAVAEKVEHLKRYPVAQAMELVKQTSKAKFDESIDLSICLGVDAKQSDQMVRGSALLPHGTGKSVRVLVFAKGEKADEAKAAGAEFIGAEELVEKIKGGWTDFEKAIATPDMMAKIGSIAKILGPRGLMPNPKTGTVTMEVGKAVQEQKKGKVDFRIEKSAIVHAPIGKASFTAIQLKENFEVLMDQIMKQKPAAAKGIYVQRITVSSTMGPGIKIDISEYQSQARG